MVHSNKRHVAKVVFTSDGESAGSADDVIREVKFYTVEAAEEYAKHLNGFSKKANAKVVTI